jgi:hypothetical protein
MLQYNFLIVTSLNLITMLFPLILAAIPFSFVLLFLGSIKLFEHLKND